MSWVLLCEFCAFLWPLFPVYGLSPNFKTGDRDPAANWRCREFLNRNAFRMHAAAGNHIEVADFFDFAEVRIFNPRSQRHASDRIQLQPSAFAERDLILMVISDRTFRLISNEQCAVSQLNDGSDPMETRHDRRETHVGSSSQIEIVIPIAQGKAAGFLTQTEEQARKVSASAGCDDDVLAVTDQLNVNIGSGDGVLSQRQSRLILQSHVKQHLRRGWCLSERQD